MKDLDRKTKEQLKRYALEILSEERGWIRPLKLANKLREKFQISTNTRVTGWLLNQLEREGFVLSTIDRGVKKWKINPLKYG